MMGMVRESQWINWSNIVMTRKSGENDEGAGREYEGSFERSSEGMIRERGGSDYLKNGYKCPKEGIKIFSITLDTSIWHFVTKFTPK